MQAKIFDGWRKYINTLLGMQNIDEGYSIDPGSRYINCTPSEASSITAFSLRNDPDNRVVSQSGPQAEIEKQFCRAD